MPRLFLLLACAAALSTCGSPGDPLAPTPMATGGQSLKVMTFNIAHGHDADGRYDLQRAVEVIARIGPDLVGLQEVTRNHARHQCHDQPLLLAEGLRRATGRQWHHVYVQEWFVGTDRECLERGAGDGPNTEGLAFLAPEPFETVAHQPLWNTRIGLAVRVRATGGIPVIVTHLAAGAAGVSDRQRQVQQLLPWAEGQGTPRLLIGDLNAVPGAPELQPVLQAYRDAWAVAEAAGTARGIPGGPTRGTRRIDYILYTDGPGLQLEWAETVDTLALIGVQASDHHPVVASFRIAP